MLHHGIDILRGDLFQAAHGINVLHPAGMDNDLIASPEGVQGYEGSRRAKGIVDMPGQHRVAAPVGIGRALQPAGCLGCSVTTPGAKPVEVTTGALATCCRIVKVMVASFPPLTFSVATNWTGS